MHVKMLVWAGLCYAMPILSAFFFLVTAGWPCIMTRYDTIRMYDTICVSFYFFSFGFASRFKRGGFGEGVLNAAW